MNKITSLYTSSVGRKLLMGLTGLFLSSFLIVHLYVNLFLFARNETTFDSYAEFLATYPLIRPLEIVLFAGFLIHAIIGVWLWLANRRARPERYAVSGASHNSDLPSRITFWTGLFVALFLVIHINSFFITSRFGESGKTMYQLVAEAFSSPLNDAFYIVALIFLAYHLKHGFQSAFQTFGLRTGKYRRLIDIVGIFFWLIIPIGFAAMPLYFLWLH